VYIINLPNNLVNKIIMYIPKSKQYQNIVNNIQNVQYKKSAIYYLHKTSILHKYIENDYIKIYEYYGILDEFID
jgi:hypothetical protein